MNKKITFSELAELLAQKRNCSKREAETFLRELTSLMTETIAAGEVLRINGLGVFKPTWVEERLSVNVQTGDPTIIPGHYKLSFTPSKNVREAVNEPFACFCVEELTDDAPIVSEPQIVDEMVDNAVDETEENVCVVEQSYVPLQADEVVDIQSDAVEEIHSETDVEMTQPAVSEQVEDAVCPEIIEESTDVVVEKSPETTDEIVISPTEGVVHQQPSDIPLSSHAVEDAIKGDVAEECEIQVVSRAYRRGVWKGVFSTVIIFVAILAILFLFFPQYFPYTSVFSSHESKPTAQLKPSHPISSTILEDEPDIVSHNTDTAFVLQEQDDISMTQVDMLVTDTIRRGVFLTNMSLKHYGHKAFWVYLYEENSSIIANPNNVPVGTVITIPSPDKYGIDANDTTAIELALEKAKAIKQRFD